MAFRFLNAYARRSAISLAAVTFIGCGADMVHAQDQAAASQISATARSAASTELSDEDMQALVARIALYRDELVALVTSASLYPLQVVEASRFLDRVETNSSLKPKADWGGSVVSLLNYPAIVKIMSDDVDWTQPLGDVIAVQQKGLLNPGDRWSVTED
ncbi:hypothetical protein AS026_13100 [Rhizobium altiplani]|uniref:DUF3300 domain-containing protein n=1 Tax=Rhizobium altiplani TaxID=1864509 RepID=A0A125Q6E8_9HYPH|nr:hypothetical protein AS026_13100 [Rhizobium altiplani]